MSPELLALSIIILLFSVILHEVMHGFIALQFGDHTAESAGRLTLNPLPHIDPIGTILLPAIFLILPLLTGVPSRFFIAWAKPVPVNPLNFSNVRQGELMVSLAGVTSNFFLALLGAVLYHLISVSISNPGLLQVLQFTVGINLMLGVFNLLPIPPLDGYNALLSRLPIHLAREYQKLYNFGFLIILLLLYFNVIGLVLSFVITPLYQLLGVPPL